MHDWLTSLRREPRALVGFGILGSFALLAVFGPALVGDPNAIVGVPRRAPSLAHLLGTNGQGQDVLAQTVAGARVTLAVTFAVALLVTLIGAAIGVTAGYFRGRVDGALTLLTNVSLVIPGLPLAIVLAAYLPPGPVTIAGVLVVSGWAWNARVFRSQALTLRRRDYVDAAIVTGESHAAIIAREIVPNMVSLLMSMFIGAAIYAMAAQVGLEFLGLGDVGAVTWGTNLYWAANNAALITGTWWEFLPTGLCLALVGFALALVNMAIDEVTNPTLRAKAPRDLEPERRPHRAATDDGGQEPALELCDLRITYAGADAPAVDGVSLRLAPGRILGLAGESGSGKSTLGHAVLRLLPDAARASGQIRVGGRDVLSMQPRQLRAFRWRRASMVLQSALNALNPVLTVREQLVDTLRSHLPMTRARASDRAAELLAQVELDATCLDAYPHTLSGGMRQRVVIAMALALEPRLLIMDEPTTALDVVVQKQILERVLALRGELGFAVLFISHDLGLLLGVSDEVGVMRRGRLVELGPAAELRAAPRHPYTRQLLSEYEPPIEPEEAKPGPTPAGSADAPLLRVRGLEKQYTGRRGTARVLTDVDFEIGRGEIVALVGQSGSGKSTIARLVARLEERDAGAMELDGRAIEGIDLRAYRSRVQKIFQDPFASLNPVHTVGYHVERALRCAGATRSVAALLESVGLGASLTHRHPHELSGGQRQRVAVARALAAGPELLVADEPTSMLDASLRTELLALVRRLARERGCGILLVTHDLASAARWADRALVLHEGRIVESGVAAEVFARPRNAYTRTLVAAAAFAGRGAQTGSLEAHR